MPRRGGLMGLACTQTWRLLYGDKQELSAPSGSLLAWPVAGDIEGSA